MSDHTAPRLGETRGELALEDSETLRLTLCAMAAQARHSLDIVSRHLDPTLLNTPEFVEAVSRLVRGNQRARVRLLILDSAPLVSRGHRLVELAQRLSSYIALRVPAPIHRHLNEAWLVADATGYVYRPFSDRWEATADFHAPRQARQHTQRFDEIWTAGLPDPNLRRLHL